MKRIIKDWKELNGVELDGGCKIDANCESCLFIDLNDENMGIPYFFGNERIIKILAVFGLDVEFDKEPTITQHDRNWLIATNLNYTYKIKKQFSECNISVENQTIPFTKELFETLEYDKEYTVNELMKMKVVD
jgi:hypothetical protein